MNYYSWLMAEELQAFSHFNKVSSAPCLLEQKVRIVMLIDKAYNQVSFCDFKMLVASLSLANCCEL